MYVCVCVCVMIYIYLYLLVKLKHNNNTSSLKSLQNELIILDKDLNNETATQRNVGISQPPICECQCLHISVFFLPQLLANSGLFPKMGPCN